MHCLRISELEELHSALKEKHMQAETQKAQVEEKMLQQRQVKLGPHLGPPYTTSIIWANVRRIAVFVFSELIRAKEKLAVVKMAA